MAESFFRVFGKNKDPEKFHFTSLRSRRLEVVGTKKKGAREGDMPLTCLPRARPFSLSPTTSKRLLRRQHLTFFTRKITRLFFLKEVKPPDDREMRKLLTFENSFPYKNP